VIDPFLRVVVEAGYDRTANPGVPTASNPLYFPNPVNFGVSLLRAIPVGLSLGLQDMMGTRQAGAAPSYLTGPNAVYSIGGPPVTLPGTTAPTPPVGEQEESMVSLSKAGAAASLPSLVDEAVKVADVAHVDGQDLPTSSEDTQGVTKSVGDPVVQSATTETPVEVAAATATVGAVKPTDGTEPSDAPAQTVDAPAGEHPALGTETSASDAGPSTPRVVKSPHRPPTRAAREPGMPKVRERVDSDRPRHDKLAAPQTGTSETAEKPSTDAGGANQHAPKNGDSHRDDTHKNGTHKDGSNSGPRHAAHTHSGAGAK
jgi:hypothetical protein